MNTKAQELMSRHRSIRKYKDKAVPEDIIDSILESSTKASSSGNMQAYSIIVTKDVNVKRKLSPLHFNQSMVMEAPVFITFCADFHRMRRWVKLSHAPDNFDNFMSFMIASIDAILASQNAALAAESHGLGLCYLGTTLANCGKIAKVLNCPKNVVPVVGFSLGYPDEAPKERRRLPLKGIVHYDIYKEYSDEEILTIYKDKEISGWKRYNEVPELRKMVLDSGVKNLAQIYTKLKYSRESHIEYSRTIYNCLIDQNFL